MKYIERTAQVKEALLRRPDLLSEIRATFASHLAQDGAKEACGWGTSRAAYHIGECEVVPGRSINILLKLYHRDWMMFYKRASAADVGDRSEFGAFEMYYDFVTGQLPFVRFRSHEGHSRYRSASVFSHVAYRFKLDEDWGGTRVSVGDIGALPYFQMVVRCGGKFFGQLAEGYPPFLQPKHTAVCQGTDDKNTVEDGRIIDLGAAHCLLSEIDRGGDLSHDGPYPGNLGVRSRGGKYFRLGHRLEV